MAEAEPSRSIVTLDAAKSNRSTCKATGEKIGKGEHRVGVEAYSGGHISMTWQVCPQLSRPVAAASTGTLLVCLAVAIKRLSTTYRTRPKLCLSYHESATAESRSVFGRLQLGVQQDKHRSRQENWREVQQGLCYVCHVKFDTVLTEHLFCGHIKAFYRAWYQHASFCRATCVLS